MAISILGQSAPSATTEATLYTVPASTETVISSIFACNRGSSAASVRISVSAAGGATANADYLYYDLLIPPNDTFVATVGITLEATDVMRVYASNANFSFNLFGQETSA